MRDFATNSYRMTYVCT